MIFNPLSRETFKQESMIEKLKTVLTAMVIFLALPLSSEAQGTYRLTWSISFSGDCSSTTSGMLHKGILKALVTQYPEWTFNSQMDCESFRSRNTYVQVDAESGCTARLYCSPCVRIGGGQAAGDASYIGNYQLLGPDQGMSSFTSNPADEIRQWDEEWQRKQSLFGPESSSATSFLVTTGDSPFDEEYANLIRGGDKILSVSPGVAPKGRGIPVSDDFLTKPFRSLDMREPWSSADLENVDKLPSEPPTFDYEYKRPEHPWMEWGSELLIDAVDIGFMFVKGAGFTATVLAEANINLYREVIECVMDQCTDANQIFKDAWNVDFKALARKAPELFSNVNMFVPAGSLGTTIPYHEIPEAQKSRDPIIVDGERAFDWAAEHAEDAVKDELKDLAKEKTVEYLVTKGAASQKAGEKLLSHAKYIGAAKKGYDLIVKAMETRPDEYGERKTESPRSRGMGNGVSGR